MATLYNVIYLTAYGRGASSPQGPVEFVEIIAGVRDLRREFVLKFEPFIRLATAVICV